MFLMSEVPLYRPVPTPLLEAHAAGRAQGYLAHNNPTPPRTLQYPYAYGPMVILWGWVFCMSKVPHAHVRARLGFLSGPNKTLMRIWILIDVEGGGQLCLDVR